MMHENASEQIDISENLMAYLIAKSGQFIKVRHRALV